MTPENPSSSFLYLRVLARLSYGQDVVVRRALDRVEIWRQKPNLELLLEIADPSAIEMAIEALHRRAQTAPKE